LADDDLGPISRSSQGSAIQEGDDVAIGVGRGEPNQGAVNVFRCTTPLSSKPNQEAVQASLAYDLSRAFKPPSKSSTNKKEKKNKTKKKKRLFSRREMEELKNLIIMIQRLMRKPFEIWKRIRLLRHLRRLRQK
jgi:hypothetical protein